ncbi:hypothetical protein NE237_027958 [Protea cynaroides]|uniref:GH16 domain-containing protein n=1 Tax=Protea cynaroides TaxID=273540 RepID=A0A9Q0GNH8_9MAGN|nr:hypothetical protein NE237_027958 [Protea cynaroides]
MAVSLSSSLIKLLFLSLFVTILVGFVSASRFDKLFQPSWAPDHFRYEGEQLNMKLDITLYFTSALVDEDAIMDVGAGFGSKSKYMFGKTTIQVQLVEGDSAGTVTAFYISSDGPNHNKFDFEFLRNPTSEPYLVQTNIYVNGVGNREQRLGLLFDLTKDFHSYSMLWNQRQVVVVVDETPILVFTNKDKTRSCVSQRSSHGCLPFHMER